MEQQHQQWAESQKMKSGQKFKCRKQKNIYTHNKKKTQARGRKAKKMWMTKFTSIARSSYLYIPETIETRYISLVRRFPHCLSCPGNTSNTMAIRVLAYFLRKVLEFAKLAGYKLARNIYLLLIFTPSYSKYDKLSLATQSNDK